MPKHSSVYVGATPPRKEGVDKLIGRSLYVDDLSRAGMLYGATIRSKVASGRLREIRFCEGVPWDEFTIVTAKDIPGTNVVKFHMEDQPCLVDEVIRHHSEPVVLIAHPDRYLLEKARKLVELDVVQEEPLLDLDEALRGERVVWGSDNIIKRIEISKGDVSSAEESGDVVFSGVYRTGAQEQMYIEPNGMLAEVVNGVVQVEGSLQCPFYVHTALMKLFNLPEQQVRVIQSETGGAFGGKEEYPSMIAGHACLLAYKSGKPVKLIYDRAEDLEATTKRHPSRSHVKTVSDRSGKLKSIEIDFFLDSGAYATVSPVVLSRGAIHAAGPYSCDNVRVTCKAVATNYPPYGAFRGFGAPQSIFAIERHLDCLGHHLGVSPVEMRRRNLIKKGELSSTCQKITDDVDMQAILQRALDESDYEKKLTEFAEENKVNPRFKRGIGLATFYHGAGFTGSGEKNLAAIAGVEFHREHGIRVLAASTEMGQGKNTIFCQIAADALAIPYDNVSIAQPDTFIVPNSGPTVASRTAMIVGWLVEQACEKLVDLLQKSGLLADAYTSDEFERACAIYLETNEELKCFSQYEPPGDISWDEKMYKGEAYAAYGWAAYVAQVRVDLQTYETTVEKLFAVQDIGKVLHPTLCAGQIEGGVTQGIGYATCEEVVWKDGAMKNARMTSYIIHTAADAADIKVFFEESATPYGPGGGAKGVGELPMDGPAPAIVNAIENATGVSVKEIPVTPEAFFELVRA